MISWVIHNPRASTTGIQGATKDTARRVLFMTQGLHVEAHLALMTSNKFSAPPNKVTEAFFLPNPQSNHLEILGFDQSILE